MPTQKNAKTLAKSLRAALADRNVSLSHSACLEIVARQLGFADWNILSARLPAEEEQPAADTALPTAVVPKLPLPEAEATAAPWTTCSFCGKSRPEVRIVFGGCGGWEGFRARRGLPERSNVFICHECVTFAGQILADNAGTAEESRKT